MKKKSGRQVEDGNLTASVKPAHTELRDRAIDALVAADVYVGRLMTGLHEASALYRDGKLESASQALAGSVLGIHSLADLLAEITRVTAVETPPTTDQELGRIALSLHEIHVAQLNGQTELLPALIEQQLVESLDRLAHSLESYEQLVQVAVA